MALRQTVNRQTRDDKFVVNKGKQAIFTPTQKLLLPVWRLAVKSWSASEINPVKLNPKGAITVVFSQYNNKPKKKQKEDINNTSPILQSLCDGELCFLLKTFSILNILVGLCPLCAGTEDNERQ